MDAHRFDQLTRSLRATGSRRTTLWLLVGGAALGPRRVGAHHFNCRHSGEPCKRPGQCCSGRCRGRKPNKTCRRHDAGICTGQTPCEGTVVCGTHTPGSFCVCFRTTGDAAFCGRFGICRECTKDKQCEDDFGPGAACVVHECACGTTGGTGCVVKCINPD